MALPKHAWVSLLVFGAVLFWFLFRLNRDEAGSVNEVPTLENLVVEESQSLEISENGFSSLNIPAGWMMRRPAELTTNRIDQPMPASPMPSMDSPPKQRNDLWFVTPYALPGAMLSPPHLPRIPGTVITGEVAGVPAPWVAVVLNEDPSGLSSFTINKRAMLSRPPDKFSRSWGTYDTAKLSLPGLSATQAPSEQAVIAEIREDSTELFSRAMYYIRVADQRAYDGNNREAVDYLRQAVSLFPRMFYANRRLGKLLILQGDYDAALEHLLIATGDDQSLPETWNDVGVAYLYRGDHNEAIKAFETSFALDSTSVEPLFNSGLALRLQGNMARARDIFTRCLQFNDDDARFYRELAVIAALEDDEELALKLLDDAMTRDKTWTTPMLDAALIHAEAGRRDVVLHYLDKALENTPAHIMIQIYNQPAFRETKLHPESKPFESRLAAKARKEMGRQTAISP